MAEKRHRRTKKQMEAARKKAEQKAVPSVPQTESPPVEPLPKVESTQESLNKVDTPETIVKPMAFEIVKVSHEEPQPESVAQMATPSKPKRSFWQDLTGMKPKEPKLPKEKRVKAAKPIMAAKPKTDTAKATNTKQIILYILGAIPGIPGLIMLIIYMMHPLNNMALGPFGFILMLVGGIIAFLGMFTKGNTGLSKAVGNKIQTQIANAVNIHPDYIEFIHKDEKDLVGYPQRCLNDNKWYYVDVWTCSKCGATEMNQKTRACLKCGSTERSFQPFHLPDTTYRDPREFANNLNIPAHRKLSQAIPTLGQTVSVFALVIAMGVVGLLIVMTLPNPAVKAATQSNTTITKPVSNQMVPVTPKAVTK